MLNDGSAMATADEATFFLSEGCDIKAFQEEGWKHVPFPGGFKTSYAFLEDAILLLQGEGYSDLIDEKSAVAFGDSILDTHLGSDRQYVMIQDWLYYRNSSSTARQYFIDSVVKDIRLKAIVFCNTSWTQAITIRIANRLKILDLDIHICSSLHDALGTAKKLIGTEQKVAKEESPFLSTPPDLASQRGTCIKTHIQDLLDYLESIDWQSGQFSKTYTVAAEHPMLPVFDAITFIKSQLDKTYKERNLIEQQLIHHKNNLEILVQERTRELELSRQKLAEQAVRDELTGLYNRRHFMEILTAELERSKRYHSDLSMIWIDVDHFKAINDTYGHPGGDAVLIQLAQITRQTFQELDHLFRIGGEEFAAILQEISIEDALIAAERLRTMVREAGFVLEEASIDLTISIGVAMVNDGLATRESFIKRADDALYRAKRNGRDRIEWHRS